MSLDPSEPELTGRRPGDARAPGVERGLRVVIAGAGPGGLTAARALRNAGFSPVILDRRPAGELLADVGGAYDLGREVIALLHALGVGGQARLFGPSWKALGVYDGYFRPIRTLSTDGLDIVSFRRSELQRILAGGFESDIVGGCEVVGVRQADAVHVELADGSSLTCDLLIGADGVHSAVRRAVLGDGPPLFRDVMAAWGWLPADHPVLAGKSLDRGHLLLGRPASAGAAVINGRYVWSVMWPAPRFEPLATSEHRWRRVVEVSRTALTGFLPVVEATDADRIALVGIWDRNPGTRWSSGRVALVGDAAHPTSPTLGQGAQAAMVDAWVLAHLLARHPPEDAIRLFEARRMAPVAENVLAARRLDRWLFSENAVVQWLNRAMFRLMPTTVFQRSLEAANRANDLRDLLDPA